MSNISKLGVSMYKIELTSVICNLPKLLDESKSDRNDKFYLAEVGVCFGVDVVRKSDVYYLSEGGLYKIDVLVELGEQQMCSQGNHHTGHNDTWIQTDFKYYFLDGAKKVYLKGIINSPRQDEFILVDYLSKI